MIDHLDFLWREAFNKKSIPFLQCSNDLGAVSYTHLDVYKRQGLDPAIVTDKAEELILDPAVDIVVEVMGGIEGALAVHKAAIAQGKSVITANKDLIATYGQELFAMAAAAGVDLFYEAAVAGGIPIIKALKESLAGNQVKKIMGIVNGTTNYILECSNPCQYSPVPYRHILSSFLNSRFAMSRA